MGIMDRLLNRELPADTKTDRVEGKIIKVHTKGYGFINSKEIPFTRIFFHWTQLLPETKNFKDLEEGMFCEFTPEIITLDNGNKSTRARKIEILERRSNPDERDD